MTPAQRRFRGAIHRVGEPFVTGGQTRLGILTRVSPVEAATYLTGTEIETAGRPLHAAYVPWDDSVSAGASLVWNGQTYTVLRAMDLRARASTLARLLIFA